MKTIYYYLRKIRKTVSNFIKAYMINNPLPIGIIEADEAIITARRRGLIGFPNAQVWIFGLYHRQMKFGYVFVVPDRTMASLMPLIDNFVSAGSELYTDQFSTYVTINGASNVNRLLLHKNILHLWVNHGVSWTNLFDNTIHTNSIEKFWKSLRKKLKKKYKN